LHQIAQLHDGEFRITPNQGLIIANVRRTNRPRSSASRAKPGCGAVSGLRRTPGLRRAADCGLALAGKRALSAGSDYVAWTRVWRRHGLSADDIVIRMTGCPNGCARP